MWEKEKRQGKRERRWRNRIIRRLKRKLERREGLSRKNLRTE